MENHRNHVSTQFSKFLLGASHKFSASQSDRPTDLSVLWKQPHDGQRYHGFPGTGLPDEAETLPLTENERDPVDSHLPTSPEGYSQIFDL